MFRTLSTIAALSVALCLPAVAPAMNGPSDGSVGTVAENARPANLLRDGKYLPPTRSKAATVQIVRVVKPSGFDFVDAGIGAAIAAAALALVGGLAIALHRDRHAPTAHTIAG